MEFSINDKKFLNEIGVDVFSEKRNYWFVRTQKGTYYEDFINDNFIGIEWDKISDLNFIRQIKEEDLKVEVSKQYLEIDRPGYVASQIYKFCNCMKKGDIVLIPSKESKWITIGELLEDDAYIQEKEQLDFQEFLDNFYDSEDESAEKTLLLKRRKVKWLKSLKKSELDPYLYSIIYSHNAIVDANPYSLFIDRMLSQFYLKGDEGYFTYKINKKYNIPYSNMLSFLNNNDKLMDYINNKFPELNFNKNDIILKVNVQSKGPVQLKSKIMWILICGVAITALFGAHFDFEFLGAKVDIETEGLPKLISTISESIQKNKETDPELKEIIEAFQKDKENLELELPQQNNTKNNDELTVDNDEVTTDRYKITVDNNN